ncbi:hypothetical protein [Humibacter ginsenosidimutans]|uniref:Uncharacterized protein n=1 Tax=Humibacter ginsenosidimutans TaxID=2599293 RepID=A0A5B8M236_9MICO|nr:hypothetical protein [Humibacter ginsenosidimutans]QDZ14014.1 hypothetical protein FPZ11_03755 [Humibacter ginsenosidimutans]
MSQLPELDHTAPCTCESGEMCADIRPGHGLHALQLRLASATPSLWRDALIVGVRDDGWVDAVALDGTAVSLWNHGDLTDSVVAGEPVSLHTAYNVLAAGSRRFNVLAAA